MRRTRILFALTLALAVPARAAVNLDATATPAGWTHPVVPRDSIGALPGSVHPTTVLTGSDTTWVSLQVLQAGPDPSPAFRTDLRLDGETTLGSFDTPAGLAPGVTEWLDTGPWMEAIGGGRHTLTVVTDAAGVVAETNEADNSVSRQFVWKGPNLPREVPRLRPLPPAAGALPQPNCDAFRALRPSPYAWGCAAAPRVSGDDPTLRVFIDAPNVTSGLSVSVGTSSQPGTAVDFVIGHYSGTPTEYFPATLRASVGPRDSVWVEHTDSQFRTSTTNAASWPNMTMEPGVMLHVYEGFFLAGRAYKMVLNRLWGSSDLAFAVFPGTPGGIWARGAAAARASIPWTAELDTVTFVASTSEWHPIAVYRTTSAGLADSLQYNFGWVSNELLAAPAAPGASLVLAQPRPNPARTGAVFAFALPEAGVAELALYDTHGRRIRTLAHDVLPAGEHARRWDGRLENGARAPAGLYWARLASGGRVATQRVVMTE